MKRMVSLVFILIACGCAKVNLATSKPIKVDINMRVDVYQHVAKDAESIEDQIYGSSKKQLNILWMCDDAYAQAEPALHDVIQRRKARSEKIEDLFRKGYVGENKDAYLEVLSKNTLGDNMSEIRGLVADENADRKTIYAEIAQKNGADVSGVQKTFFSEHFKRAPAGSWFQVYDENRSTYDWKQK